MKSIVLVLLSILILSCESGPVEPNIKVDTKEDILRQERRLKERFERRRKSRREITKKAVEKQEKKRKFMLDANELDNTDEKKIDYYLSMALEAKKVLKMNTAIMYANKVLAIDPKNVEAREILRYYSKLLYIQNKYTPSDKMMKRNKALAKEAKANIQTQKGENLYQKIKSEANRKAPKHFRFDDAFVKSKR